ESLLIGFVPTDLGFWKREIGVETGHPGSVAQAGANPAGGWIEEIGPVLRLLEEGFIVGVVAEIFGKLCHGKVGVGVFEGDRGRGVDFVDGYKAEFAVFGEEGTLGAAVRSDAG